MHLVVFDIDGTLTNTNLEDGECYWRAICELLGLSSEQPEWSGFCHVTDVGIASELCERHLRRELTSVDIEAFGRRLATLLEVALVDKDPRAYQIPGSAEILSIFAKSSNFALALATGGLRAAELKLRWANLLNPFIAIASSNDAVSREERRKLVEGAFVGDAACWENRAIFAPAISELVEALFCLGKQQFKVLWKAAR